MCQCSQRRTAIAIAGRAVLSGDRAQLIAATTFVVRSIAQDAGKAAARARLAMGISR